MIDFSTTTIEEQPFKTFSLVNVLKNGLEKKLFEWFESTDAWGYTETDFYTQYEFSLFDVNLPDILKCLITENTLKSIEQEFIKIYSITSFQIVGITAHKLVDGYKIGVHNDFIGDEETHRFLIQVNPNWKEENGGFLMLFNSSDSKDVAKIIMPLNNTAFGFEISPKSYHAVSTVYNFSRYTIVYTFKAIK